MKSLKAPLCGCTGPPGTNYKVMKKAFDEGWGAVIAKTVSLDSSKVRLARVLLRKLCNTSCHAVYSSQLSRGKTCFSRPVQHGERMQMRHACAAKAG